jgi:hypothetical protein
MARTQEATRSSAARADEDEARRRPGPLECDRIYGGEHYCGGSWLAPPGSLTVLKLLRTDYVDLCLIHWPMPSRKGYVETWPAL